jgi:hypothetical protein
VSSSWFALGNFAHLCEVLHIGAAKNVRAPIGKLNATWKGLQMRAWTVGIAVVVAVGLIWSVAAMSSLVPVVGSDVTLASISRP